jgi:hypothetical protein
MKNFLVIRKYDQLPLSTVEGKLCATKLVIARWENNWSCLETFKFIISVTLKKMKMGQAGMSFLADKIYISYWKYVSCMRANILRNVEDS